MRDFPILVFLVSAVALWLATWAGASIFGRRKALDDHSRSDYASVAGAILTLLGLIIGFTFSMAVSRYDLRKNYEEAEANAIGTEFVRTDLLPAGDAARVRVLLTNYADLRIRDYLSRDEAEIRRLKQQTGEVQDQLWAAVRGPTSAQPTPLAALAVSGMNDVLNSQGYSQAAWWNRIPRSAWWLMTTIAIVGCMLVGYGARAVDVGDQEERDRDHQRQDPDEIGLRLERLRAEADESAAHEGDRRHQPPGRARNAVPPGGLGVSLRIQDVVHA